uniref:U4 protein n=1 Tax=XiangYang Rhabdovirus 6 TaxID=3230308 RepID=A0AAU8BDF0_9RHAB
MIVPTSKWFRRCSTAATIFLSCFLTINVGIVLGSEIPARQTLSNDHPLFRSYRFDNSIKLSLPGVSQASKPIPPRPLCLSEVSTAQLPIESKRQVTLFKELELWQTINAAYCKRIKILRSCTVYFFGSEVRQETTTQMDVNPVECKAIVASAQEHNQDLNHCQVIRSGSSHYQCRWTGTISVEETILTACANSKVYLDTSSWTVHGHFDNIPVPNYDRGYVISSDKSVTIWEPVLAHHSSCPFRPITVFDCFILNPNKYICPTTKLAFEISHDLTHPGCGQNHYTMTTTGHILQSKTISDHNSVSNQPTQSKNGSKVHWSYKIPDLIEDEVNYYKEQASDLSITTAHIARYSCEVSQLNWDIGMSLLDSHPIAAARLIFGDPSLTGQWIGDRFFPRKFVSITKFRFLLINTNCTFWPIESTIGNSTAQVVYLNPRTRVAYTTCPKRTGNRKDYIITMDGWIYNLDKRTAIHESQNQHVLATPHSDPHLLSERFLHLAADDLTQSKQPNYYLDLDPNDPIHISSQQTDSSLEGMKPRDLGLKWISQLPAEISYLVTFVPYIATVALLLLSGYVGSRLIRWVVRLRGKKKIQHNDGHPRSSKASSNHLLQALTQV